RPDTEQDRLVERIGVQDAIPERVLAPVGTGGPVRLLRPRRGQLRAALRGPAPHATCARVGHLLVHEQRPARLEGAAQPAQRLLVLLARRADAEDAADDDRPVAARRVEVMERAHPQGRLRSALTAALDHVSGDVAAVGVDARPQPRNEQPARAAPRVEHGLPLFGEPLEVLDLRPVDDEVRPPLADQAVVPGHRRVSRAQTDVSVSSSRTRSVRHATRYVRIAAASASPSETTCAPNERPSAESSGFQTIQHTTATAAEASTTRATVSVIAPPSIRPRRRRSSTSSAHVPATLHTAVASGIPQTPNR